MEDGSSSVSNLSARHPRDAMRSRTSPRPVSAEELGRCGAEDGVGQQCVGAALASHGRGHRFETCHAHQAKRFPGPRFLGRLPEDLPEDHGLRVLEHSQRRPIRAARKPKIRSPALVPLRRAR